MSAVATAIVGGAVVGAYATSSAADKSAKAQRDAARSSNDTQLYMYNQTRDDQSAWRNTGQEAVNRMNYLLGLPVAEGVEINDAYGSWGRNFTADDFKTDPGYQFRISEGQKAIERSAAARGGLNSGRTMKDLLRFGQDTASAEYQNAYNRWNNDRATQFNRLASIAGIGQTANNSLANVGVNTANNISQAQQAVGNANASAYMAQGNAINSAVGQGVNGYMNYTMMNRMFPSNSSVSGSSAGAPAYQYDAAYDVPVA